MKEEMESSVNSELSAVVGALLDTLEDKDESVRVSARSGIRTISHKSPETVIHASVYYWELHRKMSATHLSSVLQVMIETCRDESVMLPDNLAISVAELAVTELNRESEQEGTELLVSLSRLHCIQAMDGLLSKFGTWKAPTEIPSCSVIKAMGMVASCNPFGMVPYIKLTLSIILPVLPQVNEDIQKMAFAFILGKFAEAVNDYIMNLDEAPDPGIGKETFLEEMSNVYEILTNNWINTRNVKLVAAVLTALSPILPLLPDEDSSQRSVKLIPIILNSSKNSNTRLSAVRLVAILLKQTSEDNRETLRPFVDKLQATLFDFVSVTPFEVDRELLLTHYEVLQCFRDIVVLFPEHALDRVLLYLGHPMGNHKARALVVLRHLINTLPPDDETSLQRIALRLLESLDDGKPQLLGAIVALIAHQTLHLLPSQKDAFIKYIILHCGGANDYGEAYQDALHLLATAVDGAETWLWPVLLKSLLDPAYTNSAVAILITLSSLASKIVRGESSGNSFKEFSGIKILARCLELSVLKNCRSHIITFLITSAPLLVHQAEPEWQRRLSKIREILDNNEFENEDDEFITWEEEMMKFLERSAEIEGKDWASKLSKELVTQGNEKTTPFLAAITDEQSYFAFLLHSTVSQPFAEELPRSVGIAAKRHLASILNLMEAACEIEDARKNPTRLLGLMRDARAAATAEAAKASLLRCYAEICKRGEAAELFPHIERHILPWIVKQLNECKETTSKEAGLLALVQLGDAVHPNRLANSSGLKGRSTSLATVLNLLQSHTGYRPLQLYPHLLASMISLLRIPPVLSPEERGVLLSTVLDKVIGASTEFDFILPTEGKKRVVEGLGTVCSEIISDSADAVGELIDILMPWMQSKSAIERRTTLIVLRMSLKSYHDSLKYTYPGGKLEPGKLLGRILSWSADGERALRQLAVDCVTLALGINARHRSTLPDNNLNYDLTESKKILISENTNVFYDGVRTLSTAVCERISSDEIVSLAEGLIEGLLFRGESGLAAGIALTQLFKIRGIDIPRSDLYLVDNIIAQMRQMENSSCRRTAASAIKSLTIHHPEEVLEHLLHQPLPLDRGTEECWKELGNEKDFGSRTLDFLLNRLDNNHLLSESPTTSKGGRNTASFPSLSAIVSLRHLLQSTAAEHLIDERLAELLAILLKYLSGWLHVDAPVSVISTKFGFVPNREACKLLPHAEVYSVLTNILTVININVASSLLNEASVASETQAEENLVSTVRSVIRCLANRNEILTNIAQTLGKLIASPIPAQRAVAAAFYAELIGRVDCGSIWLDAIINTLYEAKADSSSLVRKLATIGLTRIAYLEAKQIDEYFDNCMGALLDGLEEPSGGDGGNDVVLESLRGLAILLCLRTERPVSPRVILALKPFIEKENWEMRLAAISAVGALSRGWMKSVKSPDDDVSDHLLGCLPCLTLKLEDPNSLVAKAARETLLDLAELLQCEELAQLLRSHLAPGHALNVEDYLKELVECLMKILPQRAEELRNAVVRGYSRSEVCSTRATSVLILGYFGKPRPEDVQRMLQLLRDKESIVKARAAKALAYGFTM